MSEDVARDELTLDKVAEADLRLYSTTTIIRAATSSEGLNWWGKEMVARAAVTGRRTVAALIEEQGDEAAIAWLMDAPYRRPKGERSATELGSAIHRWCEEYALSGERPPCDEEMAPYCEQFDRWAQRFQPEYLAAELTVYNEEYGYAGTADGFLTLDGVPLILDYKTSKKSFDKKGNPTRPWPDVGLQLASYRYAQFGAAWRVRRWERFRRRYYLLSPDERAMAVEVPKVEGGVAIHITPEHCNAHVIRCDEPVYEAFLYKLESARWNFELSRTIVGDVLEVPR